MENFGAVGKKELQHTWLENFGVVGKKGTAEHVTEKFVPSEKNNCGTGEWKILVRSKKKELQHTWLENLCRRKKRTAEHLA